MESWKRPGVGNASDLFAEIGGEIVIYKEEVTGMIVFCGGWPSQTFRLPFSGWLALAILPIFTGASHPPGIYSGSFVPREPSRHSRQENLFFLSFFLFSTLVFRRSQVLTKNLARCAGPT